MTDAEIKMFVRDRAVIIRFIAAAGISAETAAREWIRTVTEMYEELVKRLRERAAWINFPHHGDEYPTEDAKLMMDAADAIEGLQQAVEQMKATIIDEAQHTEMFDERDKKTLMEMVKSLPLPEPPKEET